MEKSIFNMEGEYFNVLNVWFYYFANKIGLQLISLWTLISYLPYT